MNPIDNHPSKVTAHYNQMELELRCYKIGFRVSLVLVVVLVICLRQYIKASDASVVINPKYSVR